MTLGWRTRFKIEISLVTRSTSALSLILSFSRIFIATCSPVIVCVPMRTLPKVPCPSDLPKNQKKIINRNVRKNNFKLTSKSYGN